MVCFLYLNFRNSLVHRETFGVHFYHNFRFTTAVFIYMPKIGKTLPYPNKGFSGWLRKSESCSILYTGLQVADTQASATWTNQICADMQIGTCELCRHNFGHSRQRHYARAVPA